MRFGPRPDEEEEVESPGSAKACAPPRQARRGRLPGKSAEVELRVRAEITCTTSTHSGHPEGALATKADPAAQCARLVPAPSE